MQRASHLQKCCIKHLKCCTILHPKALPACLQIQPGNQETQPKPMAAPFLDLLPTSFSHLQSRLRHMDSEIIVAGTSYSCTEFLGNPQQKTASSSTRLWCCERIVDASCQGYRWVGSLNSEEQLLRSESRILLLCSCKHEAWNHSALPVSGSQHLPSIHPPGAQSAPTGSDLSQHEMREAQDYLKEVLS